MSVARNAVYLLPVVLLVVAYVLSVKSEKKSRTEDAEGDGHDHSAYSLYQVSRISQSRLVFFVSVSSPAGRLSSIPLTAVTPIKEPFTQSPTTIQLCFTNVD